MISRHTVHLFDTPESREATVAEFLQQGYEAGENLLLIARPQHAERILSRLTRLGYVPGVAQAERRLTLINAAAMLDRITVGSRLNRERFDSTVTPGIRDLASASRPLRVYGEGVEILAEHAEHDAALALERCWDALCFQYSFTLMCGYSSAHFAPASAEAALRKLCRLHESAHATPDDVLGGWLLARAGVAGA